MLRAEVPREDLIDVTTAVGTDGTCACKVSTADGDLASGAPDLRALEPCLRAGWPRLVAVHADTDPEGR